MTTDVDYTARPLGTRVRLPAGRIVECPCGKRGLALVYSARRGKYDVAIWHSAIKDEAGFAPLRDEGCDFRATTARELPARIRELLP